MVRTVIITFFLLGNGMIAGAQPDRMIWLGTDILTWFEWGPVTDDSSGKMLSGFLRYWSGGVEFFGEYADETTDREGVVLKAKATTMNYMSGRTMVYNETDSCRLQFNIIIEQVRHGRSAATSIMNIFSKRENKDRQDEPYTTIDQVTSSGAVRYGNDSAAFHYTINYKKDRKKPGGWLVLRGDTLQVDPVAMQVKKNGKIKKPDHIVPAGLLLMKGDNVYAALDQAVSPYTVYIARQLTETDKLVIAAFLLSLPLSPGMLVTE